MKTISIALSSLILVSFFALESFAFRCGAGLVTTGNSKVQVSETCGQPTSKDIICPKKTKSCPNIIEVWYYNCGSADYIYALTFEDGKLTKETTEGSGSGKSDCRGK